MTEEPYRWVEAVQNRREYIHEQLAAGSPIVALSCAEGVLLVTVSHRGQRKLFEVYDRIAMGAIGHPGDIERLRMSAIEVASAEGFNRSSCDVSLRRMAAYSLSPALKTAFEQIYGAPFLARLLFAELGRHGEPDLLLRLDYDGAFEVMSSAIGDTPAPFAVVSGKDPSARLMERYLDGRAHPELARDEAIDLALNAWSVGHLALRQEEREELPAADAIAAHRQAELERGTMEAALLDRKAQGNVTFRHL